MSRIAYFHPRNPRACNGCGTSLVRAPAWHTLCRQCFSYGRLRAVLADHMRVVREQRS